MIVSIPYRYGTLQHKEIESLLLASGFNSLQVRYVATNYEDWREDLEEFQFLTGTVRCNGKKMPNIREMYDFKNLINLFY